MRRQPLKQAFPVIGRRFPQQMLSRPANETPTTSAVSRTRPTVTSSNCKFDVRTWDTRDRRGLFPEPDMSNCQQNCCLPSLHSYYTGCQRRGVRDEASVWKARETITHALLLEGQQQLLLQKEDEGLQKKKKSYSCHSHHPFCLPALLFVSALPLCMCVYVSYVSALTFRQKGRRRCTHIHSHSHISPEDRDWESESRTPDFQTNACHHPHTLTQWTSLCDLCNSHINIHKHAAEAEEGEMGMQSASAHSHFPHSLSFSHPLTHIHSACLSSGSRVEERKCVTKCVPLFVSALLCVRESLQQALSERVVAAGRPPFWTDCRSKEIRSHAFPIQSES